MMALILLKNVEIQSLKCAARYETRIKKGQNELLLNCIRSLNKSSGTEYKWQCHRRQELEKAGFGIEMAKRQLKENNLSPEELERRRWDVQRQEQVERIFKSERSRSDKMRFILLISFVVASAMAADQTANDKDVAHWIEQAEKNVNTDLDKWPEIVKSGDSDQMHKQLEKLQDQINSAGKNMKRFVPVLSKGVSGLNYLAQGGSIKRMALRAAVNLLVGKRDNKSYYLLDGASKWIQVRIDELKKDGKHDQLVADLTALNDHILSVRDQLDSDAGKFVANLNALHAELNSDELSEEKIREIADKMYNDFSGSGDLLNNNQQLMDRARDLVKKN